MLNTLTIQDLISTLQEFAEEFGDDTLVVASCDYGDYHHTEQLIEIEEIIPNDPIKSAYSRSGYAFNDEEYEYGNKPVIVLRSA